MGRLRLRSRHRLLCGDSTKAEDVERLMDGETADMVFTDPPYGMSYRGKVYGKNGLKNDGDGEWESVLQGAVELMPTVNAAICFSTSRLDRFFECTKRLSFKRILTIYKPNRVAYPWRSWILTSEVIALFDGGGIWPESNSHSHDVYVHDYSERPDSSVDHPTVKPLSIVADIVQKLSDGSIVYDPFLGSGTTLVAAEQLDRRCFGMEIDPSYCDVIVKRWENLTGEKAVLADA
jgi:DNA modification methylase